MLGERLPGTWSLRTRDKEPITDDQLIDALIDLTPPDGEGIVLGIEVKRAVTPLDVRPMLDQITSFAATRPMPTDVLPVLVARYLPESTRERIAAAGAGYIDATGNIRIVTDRPALFLSDRGADSDPWRGPGRPRSGLRGEPAARVVRALVDFAPPYTVPELAECAGSSTGATYRISTPRTGRPHHAAGPRPITDVRWRDLLIRWSQDYRFAESNAARSIWSPRVGCLVKRLEAVDSWSTLSLARSRPRVGGVRAIAAGVDLRGRSARLVGAPELRPTDTGATAAVAAPRYDVVSTRAQKIRPPPSRWRRCHKSLLTSLGPGRNPRGDRTARLDRANEPDWRR